MRLVDWRPVVAGLVVAMLGCACCALAVAADKPGYGKVDTFEPGKKYSCVPTADHKGWDCTQSGKASDAPPPARTPEPPATPPSAVAPPAPAAPASASPAPVTAAAPPAQAAAPAATHSGELPSYLSARAAGGAPPSQQPMPAPAPAAKANVSTNPQVSSAPAPREQSKPATPPPEPAAAPVAAPSAAAQSTPAPAAAAPSTPAPEPAPVAPSTPRTAASEKPVSEQSDVTPSPAPQAAAPAPAGPVRPATAPVASASAAPPRSEISTRGSDIPALGSDAFLGLSGEQYVIELAHAASEAGLAAPPPLPRGEVYKLHLQQNGADVWLLLWGSFDDVSAARAARAELAASAAQTPGWPRRVAPLQAEARRARD